MSPIKYCEYEMLELFESEPISGKPKQPAHDDSLITYRREDEYGLSILFCFDTEKSSCSISFFYKPWETPIVEFELTKVTHFECTRETLIIRREHGENEVLLTFKPHMSAGILIEEEFPIYES